MPRVRSHLGNSAQGVAGLSPLQEIWQVLPPEHHESVLSLIRSKSCFIEVFIAHSNRMMCGECGEWRVRTCWLVDPLRSGEACLPSGWRPAGSRTASDSIAAINYTSCRVDRHRHTATDTSAHRVKHMLSDGPVRSGEAWLPTQQGSAGEGGRARNRCYIYLHALARVLG